MLKEVTTLTDDEIVSRVLAGEKEFYELIMRRYNSRMYRVAMSIISDDAEAEDIMQAAYISAYKKLSTFKSEAAFSTWLTRIVMNEALQRKKQSALHQSLLTKNFTKAEMHFDTPLNNLLNNELKNLLEHSISALPEKLRTVFMLREIEGLNVNETMDILGISESNVKVRLNRAKEMLRTSLSKYYQSSGVYEFNLIRCDKIVNNVLAAV